MPPIFGKWSEACPPVGFRLLFLEVVELVELAKRYPNSTTSTSLTISTISLLRKKFRRNPVRQKPTRLRQPELIAFPLH